MKKELEFSNVFYKPVFQTHLVESSFPYVKQYLCGYSVATLNDQLYLFGGVGDGVYLNYASRFDGAYWTNVGELLEYRQGLPMNANGILIQHFRAQISGNRK